MRIKCIKHNLIKMKHKLLRILLICIISFGMYNGKGIINPVPISGPSVIIRVI
jgi:hypothetical protein